MTKQRNLSKKLAMSGYCLAVLLLNQHVFSATRLVGSSLTGVQGAILYDIDPVTGSASNPRVTGVPLLIDVVFTPEGTLYGFTNNASPSHPNSLFVIDVDDGTSQWIGASGLDGVVEGDLAYDKDTELIFGLYDLEGQQRKLFTINKDTGAATRLDGLLAGDPSGLAFDGNGTLYALDTNSEQLMIIDKNNGSLISVVPLNRALGSTAGMAFDAESDTMYVVDGESGGSNRLFTLDTSTGALTEIGPIGTPEGLAGLAITPEPGTLLMIAVGVLMMRRGRGART